MTIQNREPQKPSVGRVVHYVSFGTPKGEFVPAHRAAIVTEVSPTNPSVIKVCVLNPTGIFFSEWLSNDEVSSTGGTWHWPERE